MGKILNGILGGVSGKVGGVVGGSWKGIDYLRAYAIPANPNTAGQQTQRGLMAGVVSFARAMLGGVIHPFWNPFASGQSGYNSFCSENLKAMTSPTDFDNAIVSKGNLEKAGVTAAFYDGAAGEASIVWDSSIAGNGLATDRARLVVFDTDTNFAFISDGTDTRTDGNIVLDVGQGRTPSELRYYLFFERGTGETLEVSDSVFYQPIST